MTPRKVLIIRFSSIGDVVLVAPVVNALLQKFPGVSVDLLTKKHIAPVWNGDPRIRVRSFDPNGDHYGLPGFLRYLRELRAENYDTVIDLHGVPKSFLLSLAVGGKTFRYEKGAVTRRRYVSTKKPPAEILHTSRRYLRALKNLGIDTEAPLDPHIEVPKAVQDKLVGMLKAVGIQSPADVVALAPGSQWATKQWGWERFGQLVERLNAAGKWAALIGGPEDKLRCEELAMGKKALNFAGLLSLQETLALMDLCRLMVTNDSGPMHMAGARGVPVVAVFGSTTPALGFWPLAPESVVLEASGVDCRPCSPHGMAACPQGHFRCMNDVSVDRVWQEIEKRLGPPPPPPPAPGEDEGLFMFGPE